MTNVRLTVNDFTFPADLKDKYAAFRLVVTLRYSDSAGKLIDVMEVVPGAGDADYWECEKGNKNKPNYVRDPSSPRIDTSKVSVSRREAIFSDLDLQTLERVTVKIYDVEKDGKWDKIAREAIKIAFGVGLEMLSAGTALTVGNALSVVKKAKAAERSEVEKAFRDLIDARAKAGKTRLLWEHSADVEGLTTNDPFAVTGNSQLGVFTVSFATKIK